MHGRVRRYRLRRFVTGLFAPQTIGEGVPDRPDSGRGKDAKGRLAVVVARDWAIASILLAFQECQVGGRRVTGHREFRVELADDKKLELCGSIIEVNKATTVELRQARRVPEMQERQPVLK